MQSRPMTQSVVSDSGPIDDLVMMANEAPVVKLVNLLLIEALDARASDIHLEAYASGLHVRYRVDGVLQQAPSPPPISAPRWSVVSRSCRSSISPSADFRRTAAFGCDCRIGPWMSACRPFRRSTARAWCSGSWTRIKVGSDCRSSGCPIRRWLDSRRRSRSHTGSCSRRTDRIGKNHHVIRRRRSHSHGPRKDSHRGRSHRIPTRRPSSAGE